MSDLPRWMRPLTRLARRAGQVMPPPQDARLDEFTGRLDQLRTLAETATDSRTAVYFDSVWREMGEELGFVAEDLDQDRIDEAGLVDALDAWNFEGRTHLRYHDDAARIFQRPADAAIVADLAALDADLTVTDKTNDLIARAFQADLDAGRLDGTDAADRAAELIRIADQLRQEAYQLRRVEVDDWVERGGVDLGHGELVARIQLSAAAAHRAGDRDLWATLTIHAERLEDSLQEDGLAAMQAAVTLPEAQRPAFLASQEAALRQRVLDELAPGVDDLDPTVPVPIDHYNAVAAAEEARRLQYQEQVEGEVRSAYELALMAREDRSTDGVTPGSRWLSLTDLRAELDWVARRSGHEPYSREAIDAALQRLTRDTHSTVHVIGEDADHLLDADREAAVRFGGADRHLIRIDHPEYPEYGQAEADGQISRVDRAGFDAERLDDAGLPQQAASLREQAVQLRVQADDLGRVEVVDLDRWSDVEEWMEQGTPPDLGHAGFVRRLAIQADAMVEAGDLDTARQLRVVADLVSDDAQTDEWWAMSDAIGAPDRAASIEQSRSLVRADTEKRLGLSGLQLPPEQATDAADTTHDNDTDYEAGARLQREHAIERAVQHAYVMVDDDSDLPTDWLTLDSVHTELERQARQAGRTPYNRDDIDSAIERLTRDGAIDGHTVRLSTDPDTGRPGITFNSPAPTEQANTPDTLDDHQADTTPTEQSAHAELDETETETEAATETETDADEFEEKSAGEHFEDWMDQEAAKAYGEQDDLDDPVRPELRGKGWLGEPLTDADKAALWRDAGPQEDLSGDFPAPGDNHRAQAAEDSDDDSSSANDDSGVADLRRDADTVAVEETATEAEPVAVTETTACKVAVTRAHCVIDAAHEQLDTVEQETAAERDAELARWHADDTAAAQAATEQAVDDTTVHGQ